MAPIKPYKPNDLNVNPFAVAQGIALPYDYNGTLNQFQEWNKLANNEAIADQNQIQANEAQDAFDLKQKREEAVQARIEAGEDPLKLDYAEISKSIGDWEGYVKAKELKDKSDRAAASDLFKIKKDLGSMSAKNPEYAQQLANEMGIGGFRAPAQKGDKPEKPKVPKIELWTNGRDTVDVDVNDPAAVSAARKNGLISLGNASKAQSLGIDVFAQSEEEAAPKDSRGFFSFLNGDESKNKAVNPGSSAPPPGFEYTGKVDAQGRKGIRKIR